MKRALPVRDAATRESLRRAFDDLGYEVIPFKKTEQAVLDNVPKDVRLTVTASPAKGQDVTIDLTVALVGHGYTVAPHLSAQQVRDRAHLADVVARDGGSFLDHGPADGASELWRPVHCGFAAWWRPAADEQRRAYLELAMLDTLAPVTTRSPLPGCRTHEEALAIGRRYGVFRESRPCDRLDDGAELAVLTAPLCRSALASPLGGEQVS